MFEDLFGNLQKQQLELQQKLSGMYVEVEAGEGAITVKAAADLTIANIKINPEKVDPSDHEQLEDLLIVAVNEALDRAREKAASETSKLLGGMMPGGMGNFLQ